jgi:hypothetical protein
VEPDGEPGGREFLVWTTTPWTIPSNVALAVHPDLGYAEVEHEGAGLIVAEALVAPLFGEDANVRRRYSGGELIGLRYRRPFDLVPVDEAEAESGWRVIPAPFVSEEEGTGIVHIAPAFGSDDYAAGQEHGLPMLRPIDDAGRFREGIELVGGQFVKDADPVLLDDLRSAACCSAGHRAPLLPPLLALRQPAHLHGPGLVVHPDHGGEGADAGEQPAGGLAPARDRDRPVRRVARGERRLGAVAGPLLGHAAPRLGVRRGPGPPSR